MDITLKKLIFLIAALTVSCLAYNFLSQRSSFMQFKKFQIPNRLDNWEITENLVQASVKEILETDDVYAFTYNNNGKYMYLSIVFYPSGNSFFHLPESCTVGSGESILNRDAITVFDAWGKTKLQYLEVINARGQKTFYLYAFATQEKAYGSLLSFKLHLIKQKLSLNPQPSALFRISYTYRNEDRDNTSKTFLTDFWTNISPFLRKSISDI